MADSKISAATVLSGSGLVSTPVARAGSTTQYRRVDNLSATTDPTVNDDSADGFHAGSQWFRTDTGEVWSCLDATAGAAVWVKRPILFPSLQLPFLGGTSTYLTNPVASRGTGSIATGQLRIVPIIVPYRRIFTRAAFELTTLGTTGSLTRIALYRSNPAADYKPTAQVSGTEAEFATDATTGKRETPAFSADLDPGVYWGAMVTGVAAPTVGTVLTGDYVAGYDFINNAPRSWTAAYAYAALPADLSATSWSYTGLSAPIIGIR